MTETYLLDKAQLEHYQNSINSCLDAEPELWNRRFANKEDIWHNVYSDYIQMWAVCDADCIHCVLMTEINAYPKRSLKVFWAYGNRLIESLPCLELVLERFASGLDCEEIVVEGRRGWERFAKSTPNWEFMCSTYRRPVQPLKEH